MGLERALAARRRRPTLPLLLMLLAGAWLRWRALLLDRRFTPDEAFFSTFARAAAIKGEWWLDGPLDKPPLALYANALSQAALGPLEPAARLPGALAGILLLPLLYVIARDLYRDDSPALPLLTLLLAACSPLLVAAGPTALTDSPMLTAVAASFWLALRGRPGWSGLLLGIALACKLQALLVLPLIIWAMSRSTMPARRPLLRFVAPLAGCAALLLPWDGARAGPGFLALALSHNLPEGLTAPAGLPGRLLLWLGNAADLLWPGLAGALLLSLALAALLTRSRTRAAARHSGSDLALALFIAGYSLLHLLPAHPLYARYLLPLTPALLPLCARGLLSIARRLLPRLNPRPVMPAAILVLLLLQPAPAADPHAGIDDLGAWLADKPVATVVYDRWLSWQLGYYLGVWHDKRLTWYPQPAALAADVRRLCEFGYRYLPAPVDAEVAPWLDALRDAGFVTSLAWQQDGYRAWRLEPPWKSAADCPAAP